MQNRYKTFVLVKRRREEKTIEPTNTAVFALLQTDKYNTITTQLCHTVPHLPFQGLLPREELTTVQQKTKLSTRPTSLFPPTPLLVRTKKGVCTMNVFIMRTKNTNLTMCCSTRYLLLKPVVEQYLKILLFSVAFLLT